MQVELLPSMVGPGKALFMLDYPVDKQDYRSKQKELRDCIEKTKETSRRR